MNRNNKVKFAFMFLAVAIICMGFVSSSLENLGTFEQDTCITISQTCVTCTYINISSISNNVNSTLGSDIAMVSFGNGEWRYDFCDNNETGRYDVRGIGDINTVDTSFAMYYEITPNGNESPSGIVIVIFSIGFLALLFFSIFSLLKMIAMWKDLNVDILDVATSFGIYFVVFAFYYLVKLYMGNPVMEELILLMIKVGAVTHVFVPLTAFLTSMIFNPIRKRK